MLTHHHDGIRVTISPRGMDLWRGERPRFVDEERFDEVIGAHTAILIGSGAGLVLCFAGYVLKQLLGL